MLISFATDYELYVISDTQSDDIFPMKFEIGQTDFKKCFGVDRIFSGMMRPFHKLKAVGYHRIEDNTYNKTSCSVLWDI